MPLTRQYALLAKIEAIYGTREPLVDVDAHLVGKPTYKREATPYYRPVGGSIIAPIRPSVIQKCRISFGFTSELKGNSVAYAGGGTPVAPDYDAFLRACGFAAEFKATPNRWVYTRVDPVTEGITIEHQQGKLVVPGIGCRGNLKADFLPGDLAKLAWDFKGIYVPFEGAALTEPDFTADIMPPLVAETGFDPWSGALVGGAWGHMRKASLDLRNNVVYQESMTVGTHGISGVHIVGYGSEEDPGSILVCELECSLTPEEWHDRWESREMDDTTADLAITVGSVANNVHQFQFGRLVVRSVNPLDMDGRMGVTVEFGILATEGADVLDDLVITAS